MAVSRMGGLGLAHMSSSYNSMWIELMHRRELLTKELAAVNAAIAALAPLALYEPDPADLTVVASVQFVEPVATPGQYAKVSVRWAALWHMAEFASGPMRNFELADAIRQGGYQSKAGNFPNAVSAVLCGMRERGEVDGTSDGGYYVTEKGKQTWALIKQGKKFRDATSPAPSEDSLLSVQ
jgi:hypothetical protein